MEYFCVSCQRVHTFSKTKPAQIFIGIIHEIERGRGYPIGFCKVKEHELVKPVDGYKDIKDAM